MSLTLKAFLFLLMISTGALAQAPLFFKDIRNSRQATKYIAENPSKGLRVITLSDDRDTAAANRAFFNMKPGDITAQGSYYYKVLEKESFDAQRCSYIYFDGEKFSFSVIDTLRESVIRQYRAGRPFAELAGKYTMDGNSTGDTGWFGDDVMVKDFENAVREHAAGDLFVLNLDEKKWYYVVLKTHEGRRLHRVTLLLARSGS